MSQLKTNSITNIGNTGDDNITLNSDGSTVVQDLTATSYNTGQLAGFRNQLINGQFQIDQRGMSGVELAGSKYCLDRWFASSTAVVTILNKNPGGLPNAISYTGGNDPGYLRQAIELPFAGTTGQFGTPGLSWTFSVYSNTAPEFEAFYADGNTTTTRTNWVNLTTMTATGRTAASSTTGTLNQYSITISGSPAPASTNNCLVIAFRGGGFYAAAQFEPGPVATPFELRPIGTEQSLCERYIQLLPRLSMAPVTTNATSNRASSVSFRTAMRATPTMTADQDVRLNSVTITNNNNFGLTVEGQATDPAASSYIRNLKFDAEL